MAISAPAGLFDYGVFFLASSSFLFYRVVSLDVTHNSTNLEFSYSFLAAIRVF